MNYLLWNKLLKEAPKDSVLMGGAIIDDLFGVAPKDYDIFHEYKVGEPVVPANWKMTEVDWNKPEWVEAHQADYLQGEDGQGNKKIGNVYEYIVDGEHKVQLIGVMYKNPSDHFKNFDHTLTLGRFGPKGLFIHRMVFLAKQYKVVSYVHKNLNPEVRERSFKRAQKKVARYGGDWAYFGFKENFAA